MENKEETVDTLYSQLSRQQNINIELKKLFWKMKDKLRQFEKSNDSLKSQDQLNLQKKLRNTQIEVENKTHLLNILIESNNKLKAQLNSQRHARVIYSNIYKQLEKNIQKKQHQYKVELIKGILLQGTQKIINENIQKLMSKWVKKLNKLSQQLQIMINKNQYVECKTIINEKDTRALPFTKTNTTIHQRGRRTGKVEIEDDQNQQHQIEQLQAINELKKLTNIQTVQQIIKLYSQLDSQNDFKFKEYLQIQKSINVAEEQKQKIKKKFIQLKDSSQQDQQNSQQVQLKKIIITLTSEKQGLQKLQTQLSKILDMNTKNLSEQQIDFHCHRTKQHKVSRNSKHLQKMLEKASKKKSQQNYILSQQQMQRSFLENIK